MAAKKKRSAPAAKKRSAKKAPAKKRAAKRGAARRAAKRKSPARKATAKRPGTRKAAAKKAGARRSASKRAPPARKAASKRASAAKAPRIQRALAAVKGVLGAVTPNALTAKGVLDAVTGAPALLVETVGRVTHSTKPLAQKMRLREGMLATVLGAPGDARALLGELPVGAGVTTELGSAEPPFLLVFVRNQKELNRRIAELSRRLTPKTLLWVAYPKQSSKVETDLNRDRGWEAATRAGLEVVAQVAVDATWAASRLIKRS
jgi:hypothetical protein